jgi:hypothetical protein
LDAIEYINKMNELVTEDNTDYYIWDNKKLNNAILEECNKTLLKLMRWEPLDNDNLKVSDILAIKSETFKENHGIDNSNNAIDNRKIIPVNIQINYIKE